MVVSLGGYEHVLLHTILNLVGVASICQSNVEPPLITTLGPLPMPLGQEGW